MSLEERAMVDSVPNGYPDWRKFRAGRKSDSCASQASMFVSDVVQPDTILQLPTPLSQ